MGRNHRPVLSAKDIDGRELLAPLSKTLCLPQHCTFDPLDAQPLQVDLASAEEKQVFSSHSSFLLPCDHLCHATRNRRSVGYAHEVHKFTVHAQVAESLNDSLAAMALERERRARAPDESEFNARLSNWGGFQSRHDLFIERANDAELGKLMGCRELQRIASIAMDTLCAKRTPSRKNGELCTGVAWANVNRPRDLNFLHLHEPNAWSGVYFVRSGPPPPSGAPATAGHLVFRCGRARRPSDGDESGGSSEDAASHSYMAVPPAPGTLWCFPGTVPHCVFPIERGSGDARDEEEETFDAATARISIAINFDDRCPSPVPISS